MPSVRTGLVLASIVGLAVAVTTLAVTGGNGSRQEVTVLADPSAAGVQVASLRPDTVMVVHEAAAASTRFDAGSLIVDVPTGGTFRWIEGPEVVFGGRLGVLDSAIEDLPIGLRLVVSYDLDGEPVSIYGTLRAPVVLDSDVVSYKLTIFDAPGRGSSYSLTGSYDIPETLERVRVVLAGQRIDRP